MRTLVEIAEHTGENYKPLVSFESWCVAMINDGPDFHKENVTYMEAHDETDESFILLAGECLIFVGDGNETVGKITTMKLEPNRIYNIKRSVWHNLYTKPGAKVLIVENDTTGPKNTRYQHLTKDELPSDVF